MKHKKRSINKAIQRYVLFLRGVMDAILLGKQLYVGHHYEGNSRHKEKQPCTIYYFPEHGTNGVVIWSCAGGGSGTEISPEDARLAVRKHFIDRGIPVEDLDRVERRG